MWQDERQRAILEMIAKKGRVTISEICKAFDISEMTARRDLRELDRQGSLRRVHGGAISSLGRSYEPPYAMRSTQSIDAKQAIGCKAAKMVLDGDSIALDVGTTTMEVARALPGKRDLTIITASLSIANFIAANFSLGVDVRLIVTGGIVRPREFSMIGQLAASAYQDFYVDKAFIGVGGLTLEAGLTEYNLEDALVKRYLIASAREKIVVAEGGKFGRTTLARIAPLSAVQTVVTDKTAPVELVNEFTRQGVNVVIAD